MMFSRTIRRCRLALLASCALALVGASTASAAAINPLGCMPTQDLSSPLGSFGDSNWYALAPGGTFEPGTTAGWQMTGASVVPGNEPYSVLSRSDAHALRLAPNSVAVSAPMCVDETFPNFRFFAHNVGQAGATLKVEVLFLDPKGNVKAAKPGTFKSTGSNWQLVNPMKIGITIDRTALNAAAPIAFRFTADKAGDWRVDDLLVDPYRRS
jgi:hypothetical protein